MAVAVDVMLRPPGPAEVIGVTFPDKGGSKAPSTGDQWIAIVVTGLIVGGGSKGLHDLISNISKSSSSKDTPAETGGQR